MLSILIITYNRPEDALALLQSINNQTAAAKKCIGEILLLNNHSAVSYAAVESYIEKNKDLPVRYFFHEENLGVARGRNFLIEKAKEDSLLVLDDDIIFKDADALAKIDLLFDKPFFVESNTAVITLNIHYFQTKAPQLNAFPAKNYAKYKNEKQFLTSYFIGAAHLMKRELFATTGLYPIDFFYGMEEYDLSYRIINAGYSLGYADEVIVYHKESPTGRVPSKDKLSMMWYNKSVVAWRYLPVQYFYTTVFMWALFYLKKSGFDIAGCFKNLIRCWAIQKNYPRKPLSSKDLAYLKAVQARLWY